MSDIQTSDLLDLANGTLSFFERKKLIDLASDQQDYLFIPELFNTKRMTVDGGDAIDWFALTGKSTTPRHAGHYAQRIIETKDVTSKASIGWGRTVESFGVDKAAIRMNAGNQAKLIDLFGSKRAASWLGFLELVESTLSGHPGQDDGITPFGMKSYAVKKITGSSATQPGEFGGGNPSGFSSGVGLDSGSISGWKNHTMKFSNVSSDDSVKGMRISMGETAWKTPLKDRIEQTVTDGGRPNLQIYMKPSLVYDHEALAQLQNDQMEDDLFKFAGKTRVNGHPLVPMRALDGDTDTPMYGWDWGVANIVVLKGYENIEDASAKELSGYIGVIGKDLDVVYNLRVKNRRRLWVMSTAADND